MMDPLAEMHKLLREHGWDDATGKAWRWTHPDHPTSILTVRDASGRVVWTEAGRTNFTVDDLRRRLKELAAPQAPS